LFYPLTCPSQFLQRGDQVRGSLIDIKMLYNYGIAFLSTILFCQLSTAPSLVLAVPSVTNRQPASSYQVPLFPQPASTGRRPWYRISDPIIRYIWRVPERQQDGQRSGKADISRSPPGPKQSPRYGGDVVLRFKIRSAEEASALAEASNVLFLDVWEFTKEWVDVRLAKEVASVYPSFVQASIAYGSLLGSIVARIITTFAASCSYSFDA